MIIDKLNYNNVAFRNFPKKMPYEDYDRHMQKVSRELSDIASVYTWGSINEPGISDLDLLIVLKGKGRLPIKYKSIYFMGKITRYIAVHPFIIANKSVAENARIIYPDTIFKKISGSGVKFKSVGKAAKLRVCLLNDIIIRHLPRDFATILRSKKINVRELLLRLKSLTYSLKVYYLITGKRIGNSAVYEKKILELRKNWFLLGEKEQKESIFRLYKEAFKISLDIVDNFNKYLERNKIAKIGKKVKKIVYSGDKNKTIFLRKWRKSDVYSDDYAYLPVNLAAQLFYYSTQKGVLSDYIRKNLKGDKLEYEYKYKKIARKRIGILNRQAYLSENHLHFPAFFDFGYRPKKGIINKIVLVGCNIKKLVR